MNKKIEKKDNWRQDVRDAFKYFINPARRGIGLKDKEAPLQFLKEYEK